MRSSLLFVALALFVAAAVPVDEDRSFASSGVQEGPDPTPEEIERGQQVYALVCAGCHTLDPPPDSAPPMRHVARHLRQDLETFEAFAEHVRTYVPAPDAERSRLPAMAIERFGLMDPLPLTEDVLNSAAAYLWSLTEGEGSRGEGGGHGHARHQRKRGDDSTGFPGRTTIR